MTKKLIVLLLLFSYATLSEGFVSERIFFYLLFQNLSEKDFHGVLFLFIYYLAQELIYWYEI